MIDGDPGRFTKLGKCLGSGKLSLNATTDNLNARKAGKIFFRGGNAVGAQRNYFWFYTVISGL